MAAMKPAVPSAPTPMPGGFTLIELAIVMFIVTLLLGGMLLPLAGQQDIRNHGDTQKIMADARDALLGFAMANDRLPCPASAASNGVESPVGGGVCTDPHGGFLPAVTLGLSPIDAQGYLLDGWGGDVANRVRYAVSTSNTNAFTTNSGMRTTGMTALAPDLQICSTGAGMVNPGNPATAVCAANTTLSADAVAVVFSLGKNAGTGGAGAEESHNPNPQSAVAADRAFVSAPQGTAFDDQMVWLSRSTLYNRMVAAGRLP
ncbi:MAG: prepilin-type N-terminal cleavage/methylation domain-containing protein [Rhodocyclales bacterium]|jgi:prepilin-type N-terminal cleavage/methylation domain-containing protein|nr:prepilin-type N-terminal cleavage/methylation domain-containing protein [Rhodocyclales bacterium]